jgi:hydroxyacyl-ACP dehydratase HTD2-like protein with hotdog domain
MTMNATLEGKVYPDVTVTVEPERVNLFRAAIGEESDIVPPTFATAAEFTVMPFIVRDPELGLDFTRVIHAEQEYEWHRRFRMGETLTARSRIASIRQKAGNGFLTIETEVLDRDGRLVVLARATMIERGA